MKLDPKQLDTVVVTDCGSTTTKALLFERGKDRWKQTFRGEAPTTVEEPVANVTVGALNAFKELEELSTRKFLKDGYSTDSKSLDGGPFEITSERKESGIDLYLSTSSAGGGLQMVVAGVVGTMTAESAARAALGAGAIVLDTIAIDDLREDHERAERIRHLRPDIILLAGGVEGGAKQPLLELAEIILAASPRPRFGDTLKLPIIYAGNSGAESGVRELLGKFADLSVVDNLRPSLDRENLGPAREAIHDLFLSHVMSHSPGYGTLLKWSPHPIMPTPAAVGDMVLQYATSTNSQVLCADIGGATTDVFSVFKNREGGSVFNRTVSANYGMSYSVANVLIEAGAENILRWLPFKLPASEVRDRLRNKMIRPTSIPHTADDLLLEQAVCREALRLSLAHHRSLAVGLGGSMQKRTISDVFSQRSSRYELVDLMALDIVIGSGGVLSHAPKRLAAALMMVDGFELQGVTQLTVDSIFMLPHLGVFSAIHPTGAREILENDCIVNICHCIAPVWSGRISVGEAVAKVEFDGREVGVVLNGKVQIVPALAHRRGELVVYPLQRGVRCSGEVRREYRRHVSLGEFGLLLDGRNRPLTFSVDEQLRLQNQRQIHEALGLL